jgi:hypothetical protein
MLVPGCAKKTSTNPTEQSQDHQPSDATAAREPKSARFEEMRCSLVGIWLGQAALDMDKLQQKLAALEDDSRAELESLVQDFMTTIMAIDFHDDGTMDSEIELTFGGQNSELETSHGTWKIIQVQQNSVTVATVEQLADGTIEESQQSFEFHEDQSVLVTSVPVQNGLLDLNPRLVFHREFLTPPNDMAATDEQTNASAATGGRFR